MIDDLGVERRLPAGSSVALVTGAGSGIGRAIAVALGKGGTRLVLVGRRRDPLQETASAIRAIGGLADVRPADVSDPAAVEDLLHGLASDPASLDVLVHAAGVHALGRIEEASVEELDALYATNLRAPFLLARAALPLLRQARGDIVFVNSLVVFAARAGVGPYGATKQALRALADSLRDEVSADGIRVLSVFPGRTATPTQEAIHRQQGRPYLPERLLQAEEVAAIVLAALRLPRTAEVTELRIRPFMRPVEGAG